MPPNELGYLRLKILRLSHVQARYPATLPELRGERDTCCSGYMKKHSESEDRGAGSAGQSGDSQGLPDTPDADSESVKELVEEGQAFEANVVAGVEDASGSSVAEVRTRQVPEDDVPLEYLDQD